MPARSGLAPALQILTFPHVAAFTREGARDGAAVAVLVALADAASDVPAALVDRGSWLAVHGEALAGTHVDVVDGAAGCVLHAEADLPWRAAGTRFLRGDGVESWAAVLALWVGFDDLITQPVGHMLYSAALSPLPASSITLAERQLLHRAAVIHVQKPTPYEPLTGLSLGAIPDPNLAPPHSCRRLG